MALVLLPASGVAAAHDEHSAHGGSGSEILLFPKVDLLTQSGLDSDEAPYARESEAAVDFFATADVSHLRFLGEFLLSQDEHDLERGQIGWVFRETSVWFGRFHNPVGYHNPQYHHGAFLQTSTERPAIVAFEDDNGPLPMHLTGLLVEGNHFFENREIGYSLALGAGPDMAEEGLEPVDLVHPTAGTHKRAYTLKLSLRSTAPAMPEFGIFLNDTLIPSYRADVDQIDQSIFGAYTSWENLRWHVVSELYDVRNQLDLLGGRADADFMHVYGQGEYHITDSWTVYTRIERTADADNAYLSMLPGFVAKSEVAGVQYHIGTHHVLKFEFSRGHASGDSFNTGTFSWSAVLP